MNCRYSKSKFYQGVCMVADCSHFCASHFWQRQQQISLSPCHLVASEKHQTVRCLALHHVVTMSPCRLAYTEVLACCSVKSRVKRQHRDNTLHDNTPFGVFRQRQDDKAITRRVWRFVVLSLAFIPRPILALKERVWRSPRSSTDGSRTRNLRFWVRHSAPTPLWLPTY